MGQLTRTAWADTSPNNGTTYGGIDLAGYAKLTHVRVQGTFSNAATTVGTTTEGFTSNSLWGIQFIPTGNAPLTLPGDINNQAFLAVGAPHQTTLNAAWAPSSDVAGFVGSFPFEIEWAGQLPFYSPLSVLFTTGQILAGGAGFLYYGSMEVEWF
jgi:hypothetical protein